MRCEITASRHLDPRRLIVTFAVAGAVHVAAGANHGFYGRTPPGITLCCKAVGITKGDAAKVRKRNGFCITNDGFCITNDGFCIKSDGLCIENDEFWKVLSFPWLGDR